MRQVLSLYSATFRPFLLRMKGEENEGDELEGVGKKKEGKDKKMNENEKRMKGGGRQ